MAINRDQFYAALLARMQAKTAFKRYDRRALDFTQVNDQPALLVLEGDQEAMHGGPSLPTVWKLDAILVIYARTTELKTPGKSLNDLIDSVEAALERQPGEAGGNPFTGTADQQYTTLGGLVRRAWINGRVQVNPGTEGEQGIAIIPVEMLVQPQ